MKLFPVFCFERCSGTKYENKKNTDFTEVSAFGVTSCSKNSKFRNEKRPQLQSECFKIFNNYGGDENVMIEKIFNGEVSALSHDYATPNSSNATSVEQFCFQWTMVQAII